MSENEHLGEMVDVIDANRGRLWVRLEQTLKEIKEIRNQLAKLEHEIVQALYYGK